MRSIAVTGREISGRYVTPLTASIFKCESAVDLPQLLFQLLGQQRSPKEDVNVLKYCH